MLSLRPRDAWIKNTAKAANVDQDGCGYWNSVQQLQRIYHGCQPVRIIAMLDENGMLLSDLAEVTTTLMEYL